MWGKLRTKTSQVKFERDKLLLDIKNHPICKPMNEIKFNEDGLAWLNPMDQTSFKSGWFTIDDYNAWLNGGGNIVKGKTTESKNKFWHYAKFISENKLGYMIYQYIEYFDIIDENYQFDFKFEKYCGNPLKITAKNHDELIGIVLGYFVKDIKERFEYARNADYDFLYGYNGAVSQMLYSAKMILCMFGIGYYGYCNTPQTISNLSWSKDLVVAKAYYLYLLSKGVELPDFKYVKDNYYKEN